jgi:excinuclease UvrABC ATPase subunit
LLKYETSLTAKALQKNIHLREQDFFVEENSLQEKQHPKRKDNKNINCQSIYLSGQSFEIERQLLDNYFLFGDSDKCKFFNSKESLFEFVKNIEHIEKYAFNPFVTDLFIYKRIAITDIKIRLLKLAAIDFDKIYISDKIYSIKKDFKKIISFSPWEMRVIANDVEQAYNYGNGWITLISDELVEVSTRFVSIKNKIIGSPKITTSTFNRYLNSCKECYGSGLLIHIENNCLIENETASILDDDFLYNSILDNLKSVMRMEIKPAIKKLNEEGLFDFSKKFNLLTTEEKNIFFHGFIHKKFLKRKGNKNTKSDYISWKGLYFYIRDNLSKFDKPLKIAITNSIKNSSCPFCKGTGFSKELEFIFVNRNLTKNETNISTLEYLTKLSY